MPLYKKQISSYSVCLFSWALLFLPGCSKEEVVTTEKLEYRKDKNGVVRLYSAGNDDPVGRWKFARVTENYPSGQKKFEIGIVDGLRHGSFFFWQPNGLKKLTGSFEKGKREGTFTSYGRAGETLYQKNYFEDELEGNLSLYYSLTNAEVFRYFEKTREEGLDVGDIPVTSNIRLEATFSKGIPVGPYRTYYHPRGQTGLSKEDLLEEEGRFDEKGRLIGNQVCYYPRTGGLIVYLPDDKPLETVHEPNAYGLSKAIDECYLAISEIPAYRNPQNLPAKVYCIDHRGGKIAPVWSSEITELAVRDNRGNILPDRYDPNFESYRDQAVKKAKDVVLSSDLSNNSILPAINGKIPAVEIIALNNEGEIRDILWSSISRKDSLDLEQRILQKRKRIHRSWDAGDATTSVWSISSGLNLIIREDSKDPAIFLPSQL